jgi:hypothetical protein
MESIIYEQNQYSEEEILRYHQITKRRHLKLNALLKEAFSPGTPKDPINDDLMEDNDIPIE